MPWEQVQGSLVATAMLLGQKWKVFASDEYEIDNNTFPSMINALRNEWYIEAMALSTIVDKIMLDGSVSSVVYSNESSQSVTWSYVDQTLTVNRNQRSMPTFGIFTETKGSLKELIISTLEILATSCGHRYSTSKILKKNSIHHSHMKKQSGNLCTAIVYVIARLFC